MSKMGIDFGHSMSINGVSIRLPFGTRDDDRMPERIIFNGNATIVFWKDGTKTVVKASDEAFIDPEKGFLIAYFQKWCGLSKTKANKYLERLGE